MQAWTPPYQQQNLSTLPQETDGRPLVGCLGELSCFGPWGDGHDSGRPNTSQVAFNWQRLRRVPLAPGTRPKKIKGLSVRRGQSITSCMAVKRFRNLVSQYPMPEYFDIFIVSVRLVPKQHHPNVSSRNRLFGSRASALVRHYLSVGTLLTCGTVLAQPEPSSQSSWAPETGAGLHRIVHQRTARLMAGIQIHGSFPNRRCKPPQSA
jgi:hypothetical protein